MINASVHPFNVARKQNAAWEFNNCHCMPAGAEKNEWYEIYQAHASI